MAETTAREGDALGSPGESVGLLEGAGGPEGGGGKEPLPAGSDRRQSFNPLVELTLARVREYLREPEIIFWSFIFPVLLAFALGIAFRNPGPEKTRVAVESADAAAGHDPVAVLLAQRLSGSNEIEAQVLSREEAARALRNGRVALILRVAGDGAPRRDGGVDTGDDAGEAPPGYTYRYDPTRPESRLAKLLTDDILQRKLGRADSARTGDELVTEVGTRYIDFLIPGLLGLNLMGSGLWGVGFPIVTARLRKLLKRLAVTPMKRWHYLLSFVTSRSIFVVVEVSFVLIFSRLVFGYRVRGSYLSMAILLVFGGLAFAGIGLLIASRAKTFEGVSGLMNFVMMPMWLLSGTFFSAARFPEFLQPFIKILPLTGLNGALRAVMNEGAPLAANWAGLCLLLVWCVVSFALALRLFRWQ